MNMAKRRRDSNAGQHIQGSNGTRIARLGLSTRRVCIKEMATTTRRILENIQNAQIKPKVDDGAD